VNNQFAHYTSLRDQPSYTGGASGISDSMVEDFPLQGAEIAFLDLAAEPADDSQINVSSSMVAGFGFDAVTEVR
jgi:hypothetical protein